VLCGRSNVWWLVGSDGQSSWRCRFADVDAGSLFSVTVTRATFILLSSQTRYICISPSIVLLKILKYFPAYLLTMSK